MQIVLNKIQLSSILLRPEVIAKQKKVPPKYLHAWGIYMSMLIIGL